MQILANGLIQGLLLSIISLGFALVYNSTGIFHIAQGALCFITLYPVGSNAKRPELVSWSDTRDIDTHNTFYYYGSY